MSDVENPVAPPKTRKKRYCFRDGDDVLLLQTVLASRGVFSSARNQRQDAWTAITAALNRQGVLASLHSFRCRLQRLVDVLQEHIAQGKQASDFSELERLLAQYAELMESGLPPHEEQTPEPTQILRQHDQLEYAGEPYQETEEDINLTMSGHSPPASENGSGSSQKARKRRFVFREWHDVLLLKEVIAGHPRPNWRQITYTLNDQGVDSDTHSLRAHLRTMMEKFRSQENPFDLGPDRMSEKNSLLRDYCQKVDSQSQAELNGPQDTKPRSQAELNGPQDTKPRTFSGIQAPVRASDFVRPRQSERPAPTAEPPRNEHRVSSAGSMDGPRARYAANIQMSEGTVEPPTKKQRLEVEEVLQRFMTEQNEIRKEELDYKRSHFSAQQDLQRQTIALQKQALEVQDKALDMQNKLMVFMERVVDKLK
ncbi:hypothetical protein PHYBOEH_003341 [Phytophthora boehmeriae]|uniref:Uncharacterized protein n=1 Tax=Phytophthora boehmeriae TaxID=109152 RepID=A0A8T1WNV7_9STRA|nr:hypothetical protein PHYBOEH_003341 [Phytophthora boehmeriae]